MFVERYVSGRRRGGLLLWQHQVSVRRHESPQAHHNAHCPAVVEQDLRERDGRDGAAVFQTSRVQHGAPVQREGN